MSTESRPIDSLLSMAPGAVALRALIGLIVGWIIVDQSARANVPGWWAPLVAAVLGLALAVAPGNDRWSGQGITSGWALATMLGLYVGVPETDRIIGITAVVGIIWLGELTGRMRVDGLIVALLDVVLVWTAVHGSASRSGAMIAGVALLGLLVVAPIIAAAAGPRRIRPTERWTMPVLIAVQFVFAIAVARLGGVRTTAGESVRFVVVAVPLLALVTTPLIVRRSRS